MNKEVIRKYKDVFDWWLDGGKVWMRHVNGAKWYYVEDNPHWSSNEVYVKDDEYVEFRKALYYGKVVEYIIFNGANKKWHPIQTEDLEKYPVNDLRIKPDEPKFKVGDFIRCDGAAHQVKTIFGDSYRCEDGYDYKTDIKPWKPQIGDVVVCWNNGDDDVSVGKVKSIKGKLALAGFFIDKHWDYCIPYIGQTFDEILETNQKEK